MRPAVEAGGRCWKKLLGIEDKYGSIERGKAADLVLYDGDPFEHSTHVTATLMGGRVVYDRGHIRAEPGFGRFVAPQRRAAATPAAGMR